MNKVFDLTISGRNIMRYSEIEFIWVFLCFLISLLFSIAVLPRPDLVLPRSSSSDEIRRGSTRFDEVRRGLTRFDEVRRGLTKFDKVRRGSTSKD